MKLVAILLALMITGSVCASQEAVMNEYQQEIVGRRTKEARILWETMKSDGFSEETVAALDFIFFTASRKSAAELIDQLSENYYLELEAADEQGYFLIKGTTRPNGNEFNFEQWLGWVDFMVNVGFSHNCVFSTWSAYSPKAKKTWSSEAVEVR